MTLHYNLTISGRKFRIEIKESRLTYVSDGISVWLATNGGRFNKIPKIDELASKLSAAASNGIEGNLNWKINNDKTNVAEGKYCLETVLKDKTKKYQIIDMNKNVVVESGLIGLEGQILSRSVSDAFVFISNENLWLPGRTHTTTQTGSENMILDSTQVYTDVNETIPDIEFLPL